MKTLKPAETYTHTHTHTHTRVILSGIIFASLFNINAFGTELVDVSTDPDLYGMWNCISFDEWQHDDAEELDYYSSEWESTECLNIYLYDNAKAGICQSISADSYSGYNKYKDKYINDDGRLVRLPKPDGGNIYHCVLTQCEGGYKVDSESNTCVVDNQDDKDERQTNPSGEDVGETPAATENENGAATAGNDDTSTEYANTESNKNKEQNFDFSKLDKILDKYFSDSSNWKNEDGNFNTARLVSDSVAGVVLGTAGGVITSKIIKKNQIKKGFEDLKCTVGGQEVATYGDEFTVGAKQ